LAKSLLMGRTIDTIMRVYLLKLAHSRHDGLRYIVKYRATA
jgi:hypothetical protein